MTTRIRLRRGVAANWTSSNPVLGAGEVGVETDTGKLKIGDGVTAWASLDYFDGDAAGQIAAALEGITPGQGKNVITGYYHADGYASLHDALVAAPAGETVYLSSATYTSAVSLPMKTGQRLLGCGIGISTISITTDVDGVTGVDLSDVSIEGVTIQGVGRSASPTAGCGINFTLSGSGPNATFYVKLKDVYVFGFGLDGVAIDTPVASSFINIRPWTNGRHGFNTYGAGEADGTSNSWISCYAAGNFGSGYRLHQIAYSSLNGCAADANGIQYEYDTCIGITESGCGSEEPYDFTSHVANSAGYSRKIFNSKVTLNSPYSIGNIGTAYWVTNGAVVTANNPYEGSPGNSDSPTNAPTNSWLVDSGCKVILNSPIYTTALNLAAGTTTVMPDDLAAAASVHPSSLLGAPFTDNCFTTGNTAAQTTTGTSEGPVDVLQGATDIRLVFTNHYYNNTSTPYADVPNANSISIKAAVRIGSNIYPCTFGGQTSATIVGGGMVQSDPVNVAAAAGSVLYWRTEITPATSWYPTHQSAPVTSGGLGGWTLTTGLCVAGAATISETANSVLYGPSQIIGRLATGASTRVVAIAGDSLAAGSNDYSSSRLGRSVLNSNLSGGGYIARGLYTASVPSINMACSSDRAQYFNVPYGNYLRGLWESSATTLLCNYGRNDISNSRTLAQVQADLIAIWSYAATRGQRALQTTITPLTTSTDGYITTGNQSFVSAQNTIRINLNQWLRDRAPLVSTSNLTPAATGTVGALRAGSTGHPLYAVFDAATIAESAQDSGLWRVYTGRTVTDGAITNGQATYTSATAAFTSADIGLNVAVAGAGAAGVTLTTQIIAVASGTSVTLAANASTTVSGASTAIDVAATKDGLHPSRHLAIDMAACIDSTKII